MAPITESQPATALRVVTQRLLTTSTASLPHVAPLLASHITDSRNVFAISQNGSNTKVVSETNVLIHKLKTQLSALLQDKAPEARYSAVILIKATVEVGGWDILQGVGPWVRGLIGIMGRSDPPATKKLCIMTLTRVFHLTHERQSLVREITTPSLSPFITAALNSSTSTYGDRAPSSQSPLLSVVLQAFCELIAQHPNSFRPFVQQIQSFLIPLIAPTPSNIDTEADRHTPSAVIVQLARKLFTLLPVCAPRNTAADEWQRSLHVVIISTQTTADRVFRSFVENRRSRMESTHQTTLLDEEILHDWFPQPLALPGWMGIHAGVERLDGLLGIVQSFLCSTTSAAVALPVSNILDLVERILSALQSRSTRASRERPEIGRDEREGLELDLPQLHVSALGIISTLMSRMRNGYMAMAQRTLEQVVWILDNEYKLDKIRSASYTLVSQLLADFGPTLPPTCIKPVSKCVRLGCEDLLPSNEVLAQENEQPTMKARTQTNGKQSITDADSYLKYSATISRDPLTQDDVRVAAERLLILTLTNLPSGFLPIAVRTQIDRTVILTNNEEAMLASVMNPAAKTRGPQSDISILPMLARANNGNLNFEALLRPQMPTVQVRSIDNELNYSGEEQKMERTGDILNQSRNAIYEDNSDFSRRANLDNHVATSTIVNTNAANLADASSDRSALVRDGEESFVAGSLSHISESSRVLSKRNRQSTPPPTLRGDSESAEIQDTRLGKREISTKRPRLEPSEAEQMQQTTSIPNDSEASEQLTRTTTAPETPFKTELNNFERLDSDESDFEMPTLHLEPDSEEEIDEEDDD